MSDHFEHKLRQHLAHEATHVKYFPRPLANRIEAAIQPRRRPASLRPVVLATGLVILAVLLAVGLSQARSSRSQPAGVVGPWEENLTFSGFVVGTVHSAIGGDGENRSTCSGKYAKSGQGWAADLAVQVSGKPYRLTIFIESYTGPGEYSNPVGSRTVFVALGDGKNVWGTNAGDPVTITLDSGNESGALEATLTRLPVWLAESDAVRVRGHWTCRTST